VVGASYLEDVEESMQFAIFSNQNIRHRIVSIETRNSLSFAQVVLPLSNALNTTRVIYPPRKSSISPNPPM
jgi:hypothetical protein